ncbi:30S ribosomal protein S20 [Algicella marina]|uniref:Small ribosomal subunit protein bS20 n=1 Tax=Algicella marina TaxID=2683284 RepID=A0A6P1T576_9RHOB|nr:30S ribosomal protein S20 [Algicella marina]QHQ36636.1 30S ribosomal protein S20 [Algicella marina]
MANTPGSRKRVRKAIRRTEINKSRRTRVRGFLRTVEEAIASGDADKASAALKAAQPELMRSVTKGILHKNTASRKMSRLSARVKALGATA